MCTVVHSTQVIMIANGLDRKVAWTCPSSVCLRRLYYLYIASISWKLDKGFLDIKYDKVLVQHTLSKLGVGTTSYFLSRLDSGLFYCVWIRIINLAKWVFLTILDSSWFPKTTATYALSDRLLASYAAQYSLFNFCVKVGPGEPGEGAGVQQGQQFGGVATAAASADITFSQHLT